MSYPYTERAKAEEQLIVKKRKRDDREEVKGLELDTRPFCIKPTSSEPFAKTRTFVPVCVLDRAQLPLAYLDTAGSESRLFTSEIRILEGAHDVGACGKLLVAEEKEEGRLYAVERTARRVYALCRLRLWVTRTTVEQLSGVRSTREELQPKRAALTSADGAQWWKRAAVDVQPSEPRARTDRPALPRLLTKPKILEPEQTTGAEQHASTGTGDVIESQDLETPSEPVSAQDALEELSKQYLDALYLSRTSLAYFAKGPLSRARAAFANAAGTETHSSALAIFLREAILTVPVMDKKYKEGITTSVKDLPLYFSEEQVKTAKTRRKKKWKAKRDKLGFFCVEAEYLAKWWREGDQNQSMSSSETTDVALRRRLPVLRMRETYLQVIILLEALAMETSSKREEESASQPGQALDSQDADKNQMLGSQTALDAKKTKSKKQQDLPTHLDALLERLSIYHSISSLSPTESTTDSPADEPSDELRNFCIEVIVPFYTSRLPEHAAAVNKKLGGPSPPTPRKQPSQPSARSKPGDPAPRQPRKPLSRIPTESHAQPRPTKPRIPELHRSSTDPNALRTIKREPSDLSLLASIPQAPAPRRRDRTTLLKTASFNFREVDQDAQAAAAHAKLRKERDRESQIQDAIKMATKPNRQLANEEIAKRADEQYAKARAKPMHPTKPHPTQRPARDARPDGVVHVAATPRRPKPVPPQAGASTSSHGTIIPSSSARLRAPPLVHHAESTSAIPQSTLFSKTVDDYDHPHTNRGGVQDTPSRPRTAMMPTIGEESPSASRRLATIATTPVKGFSGFAKPAGRENVQVEATPVKRDGLLVGVTPVKGGGNGRGLFDEQRRLSGDNRGLFDKHRGVMREQTIYGWEEEWENFAS